MQTDVFISHSSVDKVFADALCHRLEAADIRCWVAPRDIRPSQDWAEAIIDALDNARLLLLIFSASANSSPQVRREVERAVSKGLPVLPFRIENVPLSKSLEYFISTQHWLDAINGDLDSHLDQLCSHVSLLLAGLPGAAPPAALPPAPAPAIAPATLERIAALLAQPLGPIAGHLVRRAAAPAASRAELVTALAGEIDDKEERRRFVAACHALP